MDRQSPVIVYTTNDLLAAEVVQNALRAEGIPCELGGAGQAGLSGIMEIELLVAAENADRATKLIAQHERHRPSHSQ